MATPSRAHLPALSSRLPIRSVRSCASPRNLRPSWQVDREGQPALGVQLLEGAHQALDDRLDLGDDADRPRARGRARPVEIERHLPAHDLGLLAHLLRQVRARRVGLVDEDAERRLQRVGEIADLGAGALHDLPVGVDELVHLGRQRRDVLRETRRRSARASPRRIAATPSRSTRSGRRPKRTASAVEPMSASASVRKVAGQRPFEAPLLRLDHVGVGGDLDEEAALVARVDLALDHAQLMAARSDDIAAQDLAVVFADGDEMGKLRGEQRLRGPDLRRIDVEAGDLPVPAGEGELELRRDRRRARALRLVVRRSRHWRPAPSDRRRAGRRNWPRSSAR